MSPSFLAFFLAWAERQRWKVPDIHVRACHWLEHRGQLAVMRCFRGFAKSTILDVHDAWLLKYQPALRILVQSEADDTAYKTSREVQHILRAHPWTRDVLPPGKLSVESWWQPAAMANDPRNPSMHARGVMSNVTSARADEIQNDDVEVPRNIQSPEARERLRYRLGEQVHIATPGARRLFVGTPHTHDSIYDEIEALGADCLTIRMFDREHRIDLAQGRRYALPFVPEFVFAGIGRPARLLLPDVDYLLVKGDIEFRTPPMQLVDLYAGCAWPERFDRKELLKRRRETRTINEWDSQYQLHSKPVHEIRLDPDRLVPYDAELVLERANRELRLMLGNTRIQSSRAYWDPSKGKLGSDASAFALVLDDAVGNSYWHCAERVTGELAEFSDGPNTRIIGGQVLDIVRIVQRFHIPSIYVESNGLGAFIKPILLRALAQEEVACGVVEEQVKGDKNARILAAVEPPLSSGVLWAHVRVLNGPSWDEMKDWNPATKSQPDDDLDALGGALSKTPVRIGRRNDMTVQGTPAETWRPRAGTPEVTYAR